VTPIGADAAPSRLLEELAAARGKLAQKGHLTMLEATAARGEMPPLHVHDEPEAFQVLEGTVLLFAGGACLRLRAGESAIAPAGVAHTHRAESGPARYVVASFVRSPGSYESFVRAVGAAAGLHGDPSVSDPSVSDRVVSDLASENGIVVVGPAGALPAVDVAA
jgi:quercetin dioxygenase-like cupin family protein